MPGRETALRPRVAICCQGGGSQTAFTAGVLAALLRNGAHRSFEIVTLTGTSGGAICATLAWFALRSGEARPWERLEAFWDDNTAQTPIERALNDGVVELLRTVGRGHLPVLQTSPSMPMMHLLTQAMTAGLRRGFTDLGHLLETHIDLAEVARWGASPALPNLLLGAVNVSSGQLRVFSSRNETITAAHVRASCAVPNLFPAVEVDGEPYWDGLFSDNPPIAKAIRPAFVGIERPIRTPPGSPDEPAKPWHIPMIEMSAALQARLDCESKLDRSPANIRALVEDGARQALAFLSARAGG